MTTRRSFLKGMLGLGSAIIAGPAICKAENLMKIYVPPELKIVLGRGMTIPAYHPDDFGYFGGDFTMEWWLINRSTQHVLSLKHTADKDLPAYYAALERKELERNQRIAVLRKNLGSYIDVPVNKDVVFYPPMFTPKAVTFDSFAR